MNPLEELKRAHTGVLAEENRLAAELAKVKAVRIALERGMNAEAKSPLADQSDGRKPRLKAPDGALPAAILPLFKTRKKMLGAEIRHHLKSSGYKYSLNNLAATLKTMVAEKQLTSSGSDRLTTYSVKTK